MALWKPSDKIGNGEYIGRRLYQKQDLVGAADQTHPNKVFELYHFQENRDRDVSLDRLGKTSVDRRVRAYLDIRGHRDAGRMSNRSFRGWATAKSNALQNPNKGEKLNLVASPIPLEQGVEYSDNDYHAHAVMPENYDSYVTAMHLKIIFEANYHFESSSEHAGNSSLWRRARAWVNGLFS